jgi:thioglycine synthase
MPLEKRIVHLQSRPVRYFENGFRTVSPEETLSRIEKLMLSTNLEMRFERRWVENTPFIYYLFHFLSPEGEHADQVYLGKGLSDRQCMISAVMEFVERFSARRIGDEEMIVASYHGVKSHACDPAQFILPSNTHYDPDSEMDWVWGYSLTHQEPLMVPANLVFLPYVADKPEKQIYGSYDSNGLASGNCIEEAILHGLLEVIERDVRVIMEYNRLAMPDLKVDFSDDEPILLLLKNLKACHIRYWIKDITNDIPIPSIGAFLKGSYKNGEETFSYASGTHLNPQIALSRALTEAMQLYPRCANYEAWLNSGPIDYLYQEGPRRIKSIAATDSCSADLKENIEHCVNILKKFNAEVVVVDLGRQELMFPVVRVCVTNLQPIIYPNPRLSTRFFEVPVKTGYRDRQLKPEEMELRELCGMRWKK